ncbi:MAG: hydrogenase maturation nickel metallochaperone HypA [Lachnospiraceae bacterium]|nr:hydrogenase maturation nickel metallochaperone HypA [Lachnospiraceae bacterium]
MHELGVVFRVIDAVSETAAENGLKRICSVTLKLGTVSGVVPEFLTDCWKWAVNRADNDAPEVLTLTETQEEGKASGKAPAGLLRGAELIIEPIEARTFCEDCQNTYDTVAHGRICPRCGSERTYLLQGNEFLIEEIMGE